MGAHSYDKPVEQFTDAVSSVSENPEAIRTIQEVTARGPYWLRNALYVLSVIVGAALIVLPVTEAFMTGNAADAVNAVLGVVVSLSGLFAKLNITKPAS